MKQQSDISQSPIPDCSLWQTPLSWVGDAATPSDNTASIPKDAIFTRGWIREYNTEKTHHALFHLHQGKVMEVHFQGLDGACWTYRSVRKGRKIQYQLCVGKAFPATEPISKELRARFANELEYVIVQSILPSETTNKHIMFMIRDEGELDDMLNAPEQFDEDDD